MTTQLTLALIAVGLAVAYVLRAAWKTWAGSKAGCGSGCGKCSTPEPLRVKGRMSLPQV